MESINFFAEDISFPEIDEEKLSRWIRNTASGYNCSVGALSYIFCNDEKILEINRQYLQHDYYTDIITFDYSEQNEISGDIFISLDTVRTNAEKYQNRFLDELHRVIIHGVLHLCGLNDETEAEQTAMRKAENEALNRLSDM